MLGEGLVILRDLIALRQVRIKVVLAGKPGERLDAAAQRNSSLNGEFDRFPAQHGQRPGQPQTHRADVRVGWGAEFDGAPAKDLSPGALLDVNLKADNGLV